MILGGAVGNLIDRIRTGKVIDFIDIFVGAWHWPAFNVADSALTVGIILFLSANLRYRRHPKGI
jgi:signal peptidase II